MQNHSHRIRPAVTSNVGYIVNQYPKVSHSFIRREIRAVEDCGISVSRYAIRGWDDTSLVDSADKEEQRRTVYVLKQPVYTLARIFLATLIRSPRAFFSAAKAALGMMRLSTNRKLVHLAYLAEATVLAKWAIDDKVEHLHAHFGTNSAEVAMLVHCLTGLPFSFTAHGPEEFDKADTLGLAVKVRAAEFVCAISSYGRSQIWRSLPYSEWDKVRVIHCGVDDKFVHSEPPSTNPRNRLVCVGRLCEQKGQLLLVEAIGKLIAQGRTTELVFAGDGEMRSDVEQRISELGLQDHITITGWIDNDRVIREITEARALVLPSFAEGIPVVLMEAMALERPVITTYVGGIPELVEDGVSGWLLPAGDLERLTRALTACLSASEEQLRRMGRAARDKVLRSHNVYSESEALASLFHASCRRAQSLNKLSPSLAS
ncbi:glycosyltransferase family 4 protein [Hyphomicrobium sp.]|jgi:glycosyltransferase involved in cell wall biosynthesis|uniref:glycosyltransferase family 4 protein n=1 Tax=Hyphomicrobium sp. TaxID=82 RepID=UPI002C710046|nr:glycosyltransferase family 4 protein [Hyphomicrobium sp.]HVZ04300.1 glycosyltransferase family 4 protein [Hyphomicrobium sp.]